MRSWYTYTLTQISLHTYTMHSWYTYTLTHISLHTYTMHSWYTYTLTQISLYTHTRMHTYIYVLHMHKHITHAHTTTYLYTSLRCSVCFFGCAASCGSRRKIVYSCTPWLTCKRRNKVQINHQSWSQNEIVRSENHFRVPTKNKDFWSSMWDRVSGLLSKCWVGPDNKAMQTDRQTDRQME